MTDTPLTSPARWGAIAAALSSLVLVAACGSLLPKPAPLPAYFMLEGPATSAGGPAAAAPAASAPTLVVGPPQAAAGYDSPHIVYTRTPHQLEAYAHSVWVDTPARMLAPLLVAALARGGEFAAVVAGPSAAAGELRLDTEILQLRQDFEGATSRVRFSLRATLVDSAARRVLATRDLETTVAAPGADAAGGVRAAQVAVQDVLGQLVAFCTTASRRWRPLPR